MANFNWPINPTTFNSGPIQYVKDGISTEVSTDTGTPANSTPLPVQLYGVAGEINVTAGDLNVQLSHLGANYDSTRIGDGTTLLGITGSNEAKVSDSTAQTTLSSINTKTPALVSGRVPVDGSGVTQPVSGTVTANAGTGTFAVSAASLPLPTGAATETTLSALNTKIPTLSATGTSLNVQAAGTVKIQNNGTTRFFAASASGVAILTDAETSTEIMLSLRNTFVATVIVEASIDNTTYYPVPMYPADGSAPVTSVTGLGLWKIPLNARYYRVNVTSYTSGAVWITVWENSIPRPSHTQSQLVAGSSVVGGVTQSGTWTVQPGNTANTTAWLVAEEKAATSTVSSVSGSASSVSLLASNTSRKHATFYNDSTATLYLKLGATASTSSFTVKILPEGYYELPSGRIYTGAIDGIWSSATGSVRITELS